MAFPVLRMGKKLGLVGTPSIRLGAASTPSGLRQANRHVNINTLKLPTAENTRQLWTGKNAVEEEEDCVDFYLGLSILWGVAVHWTYQDYIECKRLDQKAKDRREALEKLVKD